MSDAIGRIGRLTRERLFAPEVKGVAPIVLAVGESKKVTHEIDWKLFDKGDLKLRLDVTANSGLAVGLSRSRRRTTVTTSTYTLTAGQKPGAYTIRIVPSVGPPVEVSVTVK